MELEIYDRQGALKRKVSPDSSSRWTEDVGAEFVVTVNFTTWEFFVLSVGDYVEISGKRFSIKKEYRPKKTDTQKYTYNIIFYGREHDMQDLLFCRLNQGEDDLESVFAYDGTPMEMLEKLVANMNRNTDGVTWRAGQAVAGDRKTINFNGLFCWDAAGEIAGAWETEWWLDGEYLNIGKCEHGERVTLGYMKGLKTGLTQNENSNSIKWFTRLIPVGSTQNIDPSKYGYTHLQLPSRNKYIDLNTQLGLKEYREEAAFQDIFPHRLGTVSSVRSEEQTNTDGEKYTVYYVKDKDLPMNPDEYMIGGEVIHITFESGDLSGREFECNWHNDTQEFEIINTYPDENTQIPGGNIIPDTGDTYILTNIRMPDEYYPIAEEQYKQAVDSFLTEYSKDISIYSGDTDYIHVDKHSVPLLLGQRVRLEDTQYFEAGYLDTRITRIERKLGNLSEASIDCSSAVSTSWKSSVDSTLKNLEYTLVQEMAQTNVRLLKTGDMENPSDYTAFSSLRAIGTFLRKDVEDKAMKLITFLKGIVVKSYLKIGDFVTGISGGYIDESGNLEMESGVFRKRLFVPETAYNRTTYFKGRMVNSPGGGCTVLSYVDNGDGTYTITPDLTDADGLSQFVDDILTTYFVTKNSEGKLNGFEEMKFRVTSADYTAKKFTVIPRPGHSDWKPAEQMVLAQTGNFTDPERQTYILIDSVNGNNCITFFDNANTWDPESAQMPSWFGKKKGMTINGINCDNYSAVLQNIIMTGLIFQIDEITGNKIRVPLDKGEWSAGKYAYYDRVSHNGSLWLCVDDNGTTTEPSDDNPAWLKQVAEGEKGDPGLSVVGGGHWESSKTPYSANTMVTLANCVFLSKIETSNPPIRILRVKGGSFLRKKDGGYYLAGKPADWEVNDDWDMLLDGRELKGESITFLGEFATAPANPKNGDSYRNTTDRATYIYQDGRWQLMISDGKDGTDYEYIYTRGNIIDNPPAKPDSQQKDDYVPEGWTDDFVGVDADHQVEWGCKRFKENGVWSEFSNPSVVHRWSRDGENAIMADFDNEMVNAALTSDGKVVSSQTWNTTVSMWYGTEKLTLDSITCTPDTNLLCATDKNTGVVTISVSAGATLAATNTVKITIRATKNGQQYSRDLTFTVAGVRGGADGADAVLYSIIVSATSVSKDKNGNYSVSSVSCYRQKSVGGVISTTTDGTLKYSIDGGAETSINNNTAIPSRNFTKTLKFIFYINNQIVDIETVPMLMDGKDGLDGVDGESITAAGHWESANTPYAKNSTVTFAGGSYLSKVETSNPPLPLLRVIGGRYLRKKDGGYILSGKRQDKVINQDWQEMTSAVEPSASYWLDSPVSTINFTSTGTPSPSSFVVTMKQNVGGNVSDTNKFYLVARKYNGSWLAHVGATLSNQISIPATAGYTQFAVRAYKSASDANAWNDNYVAENGIGVAMDGKPGDKGDVGATGAFPRDRGVFKSGQAYVWNANYRDKVIYLIGGVFYNFLVKNYGASVTAAPTSVNGDSNWEAMQKFVNIATDTLFADGANVAGFMFKNNVLKSYNDEGETLLINGATGYLKCKLADITGTINATSGTFKNVMVESGRIAGFSISGNGLTNGNKDGTFTNDAYVIFRNDPRKCFAGIGGNIFPSSSGIRGVARFENYDESDWWGLGANYALLVGARGANDNVAINMNGGYIAGLAVKTDNVSSSKTIDRSVVSVACINSSEITITLPTMEIYDDGHVISIKNMNGKRVTIKPGYSYHKINGVRTYKESYMHVDQGHHNTNSNPHSLASNGDASTYRYHRDLNNGTQYGCWIQFKNPRDW